MQSLSVFIAIAAGAVFASGAAFAETAGYRGEARLASASASQEQVIEGVTWRCDGDQCVGSAARKANVDGLVRECKKVVAVLGPVASFKSGARELSDGQVKACNRDAAQLQTAAK